MSMRIVSMPAWVRSSLRTRSASAASASGVPKLSMTNPDRSRLAEESNWEAMMRRASISSRPRFSMILPRRTSTGASTRTTASKSPCRPVSKRSGISETASATPSVRRSSSHSSRSVQMMGCRICSSRSLAAASANTISRSRPRSSVPSADSTPSPNASVTARSPGPSGTTARRARSSALTTGTPISAQRAATIDLPAATFPVSATLSTSGAPRSRGAHQTSGTVH